CRNESKSCGPFYGVDIRLTANCHVKQSACLERLLLSGAKTQIANACLTALVCLPVHALAYIQTSKPALAVDPGVAANCTVEDQRPTRTLHAVSANHCFAGGVRTPATRLQFFPEEHIVWLVLQREIWIDVCVNEEVSVRLVKRHAILAEENPVLMWNCT